MAITVLQHAWRCRKLIFVLVVPLLLMPLPLTVEGKEAQCGYLMLIMGIFWCTEALPLSITALLPVVALPLFEIMTASDVCAQYMADLILLMVGGIFIALAIEKCNLHRRIAIGVLMRVGTKPKWLMLGFILPSWFMSMWISNTAAAAMMIPIIDAVMEQLKKGEQTSLPTQTRSSLQPQQPHQPQQPQEDLQLDHKLTIPPHTTQQPTQPGDGWSSGPYSGDAANSGRQDYQLGEAAAETGEETDVDVGLREMEKGLLICVAYGCNVGGPATLTGTPPNLVVKDVADDIWLSHGLPSPLDFAKWMGYGMPTAALTVLIVWLWLQFYFIGWRSILPCWSSKLTESDKKKEASVQAVFREEYNKLGSVKLSEVLVLLILVVAVLMWFFRDPAFMDGWASGFQMDYVTDAVPAILISAFLFVIPGSYDEQGNAVMLLDWETVQHKFPWNLIFLVGGGFALSEGSEVSGLSDWIGEQLEVFEDLQPEVIMLLTCALTSALTQIMSNTATATLILPIVAIMSENIGYSPLYLMLPVGVTCSFSFLMPVSTPPNAMVYATGKLAITDMLKAGIFLNIVGLFIVMLTTIVIGGPMFSLDEIPWSNTTDAELLML